MRPSRNAFLRGSGGRVASMPTVVGLTYESRQRANYKDAGRFSALGLTHRNLAAAATWHEQERRAEATSATNADSGVLSRIDRLRSNEYAAHSLTAVLCRVRVGLRPSDRSSRSTGVPYDRGVACRTQRLSGRDPPRCWMRHGAVRDGVKSSRLCRSRHRQVTRTRSPSPSFGR
jgi:hypothetical protein